MRKKKKRNRDYWDINPDSQKCLMDRYSPSQDYMSSVQVEEGSPSNVREIRSTTPIVTPINVPKAEPSDKNKVNLYLVKSTNDIRRFTNCKVGDIFLISDGKNNTIYMVTNPDKVPSGGGMVVFTQSEMNQKYCTSILYNSDTDVMTINDTQAHYVFDFKQMPNYNIRNKFPDMSSFADHANKLLMFILINTVPYCMMSMEQVTAKLGPYLHNYRLSMNPNFMVLNQGEYCYFYKMENSILSILDILRKKDNSKGVTYNVFTRLLHICNTIIKTKVFETPLTPNSDLYKAITSEDRMNDVERYIQTARLEPMDEDNVLKSLRAMYIDQIFMSGNSVLSGYMMTLEETKDEYEEYGEDSGESDVEDLFSDITDSEPQDDDMVIPVIRKNGR